MQLRNLSILVYADTASLQDVAQAFAADPRLAKTSADVRVGGILDAAKHLAVHSSPDVLIVGDTGDDDIAARLEQLAPSVEPHCKVIVVGRKDSIAIFRKLLSAGVADYLGGSVRPHDLYDAVTRLYAESDALPKGKLVACLSTSGGAGGSTLAAMVTSELTQRIGDAVLLDLDLAMGTAGLLLAAEVRESVAGALLNPGLDVAMLDRLVVREKAGRVLSTPGALRDSAHFTPDAIERLVGVTRGMTKSVVLDLPKGWSETHDRILAAADEIVLVATPELASLRNARMILDHVLAIRLEAAPARLVLNKVGLVRGREYRGEELREALGRVPAASIPWDPAPLMAAMTEGKPVTAARGPAVAAMRAFAASVLAGNSRKGHVSAGARFLPGFKALFAKPA